MPVLELLEHQNWIKYFHRHERSADQLLADLKRWSEGYKSYPVAYVASHGDPGTIDLGEETVTLEEIAGHLGPQALAGRLVYFGACSVAAQDLGAYEDRLDQFRRNTGARAACGYIHDVDWVEAAAFEMLLFSWLAFYPRGPRSKIDAPLRRLVKEYPDLTGKLGFVAVWNGGSVRSNGAGHAN